MIQVKDYSLSFGKKKILQGINYSLKTGITAIVGPSGSGKSSFVLSLNRLTDLYTDPSYAGEIFFEKENILFQKRNLGKIRHAIGTVFQKPTPFPVSIYKNLELSLMEVKTVPKQEYAKKIEEVLKKVSLWDEVKDDLQKSALRLSGGQQQKLCIARTLLLNPKVLILDEPCSSLDPISTLQIEELLKKIALETPVIIVTHNLKQAKRISEHLVVFGIDEGIGKIIEEGRSEDIFHTPQNSFTKTYLEYEAF
ncbi:phosphate ABC transporter ATP-binding protein [Bdellovibrio sp. HCB337]|uniref:phosphate ABC transporter ATP-binding protein n=1 Tax=Bdellovibrio sp. HCB337 TaxID=3394358 RepID=UPI0039A69384